MSNRTPLPGPKAPRRGKAQLFALALGLALTATLTPAQAQNADVGRGAAQPAQDQLAPHMARACWARYSTSGAQPRNGVIEETAFRVPCPEIMTSDFIATLQRALAARGLYDGPITGRADQATRNAVQGFQKSNGFNSPILTLDTAQKLGLVPVTLVRN
jgi:hypothetical protein